MAEMAAAGGAVDLRAGHEERAIRLRGDGRGIRRVGEARPAGARVELGARIEELRAAPGTAVHAFAVLVPILAGEGSLGALLAEDVVLLGGQSLSPSLIARGDGRRRGVCHARSVAGTR